MSKESKATHWIWGDFGREDEGLVPDIKKRLPRNE